MHEQQRRAAHFIDPTPFIDVVVLMSINIDEVRREWVLAVKVCLIRHGGILVLSGMRVANELPNNGWHVPDQRDGRGRTWNTQSKAPERLATPFLTSERATHLCVSVAELARVQTDHDH